MGGPRQAHVDTVVVQAAWAECTKSSSACTSPFLRACKCSSRASQPRRRCPFFLLRCDSRVQQDRLPQLIRGSQETPRGLYFQVLLVSFPLRSSNSPTSTTLVRPPSSSRRDATIETSHPLLVLLLDLTDNSPSPFGRAHGTLFSSSHKLRRRLAFPVRAARR